MLGMSLAQGSSFISISLACGLPEDSVCTRCFHLLVRAGSVCLPICDSQPDCHYIHRCVWWTACWKVYGVCVPLVAGRFYHSLRFRTHDGR